MLLNTTLPGELIAILPPLKSPEAYGSMSQSMSIVENLRNTRNTQPEIKTKTQQLRRWQTQRFRDSYADILLDPHMGSAANFFLEELYGDKEFGQRDAQFVRISGTLEKIFPHSVVQTATLLAQLHALSESLDACLVYAWHQLHPSNALDLALYKTLWKVLLHLPQYDPARASQLKATEQLGHQLHAHTRMPGLLFMLKMMRAPASAAGLMDLQRFLEYGFETFARLGRSHKASLFLNTIVQRESEWLASLRL
jgi:acyl carrier protein phosphodiesterase